MSLIQFTFLGLLVPVIFTDATTVALVPTVTLSDGQRMPIMGFGTYAHSENGDRLNIYQAVRDAIRAGWRHIDTAHIYQSEDQVGHAIKDAITAGEVTRDQLFVTTKLWLRSFERDHVVLALNESLHKLQLDYVNLYLIHWPIPIVRDSPDDAPELDNELDIYTETWGGMEDVHRAGLTKSIGVSNFNSAQIEKLLTLANIRPVLNQVESHPFQTQSKLLAYLHHQGVQMAAFSPMGGSPSPPGIVRSDSTPEVRLEMFASETIQEIAAKHSKNVGQVLLKYHVTRGIVVISKSTSKHHILSNLDIFDFSLDDEDMARLNALNANVRHIHSRPWRNHKNYPFTGIDDS